MTDDFDAFMEHLDFPEPVRVFHGWGAVMERAQTMAPAAPIKRSRMWIVWVAVVFGCGVMAGMAGRGI